MNPPNSLFRYRSLGDDLIERELNALQNSYLFSPSFSSMNDPMEAFYETGGVGDRILKALLPSAKNGLDSMYKTLSDLIDNLALISFSTTHEDLPLWAYYASNFGGICLEFDTTALSVGDLQNEKLHPVTYSRTALPPISLGDLASDQIESTTIARITRKRSEWAHEKEWRFITGKVGPKYYLDDTLKRVFMGPRINPIHARRICEILDRRPVEVLQGEIRGFELTFHTVKPPTSLAQCERVGKGKFERTESLYAEEELKKFLSVPFETLLEQCRCTALRPNTEQLHGVDIAADKKELIYFWTSFKLRSGREVWQKRYFDRYLNEVLAPN